MFTLNLPASPSSIFLGRHLGISSQTAWRMTGQFRRHLARICASASRCLQGQTVYVENLRLRNVLSAKGRRTRRANVLIVATADEAFAFVVHRRYHTTYQRMLEDLGVNRKLYTFDFDFGAISSRLRDFETCRFSNSNQLDNPEIRGAFGKGRSLAVYLAQGLNKWPTKVRRQYLQEHLADFVFRFNFAHDKAMMFPLFLASLGKVSYGGETQPRARTVCIDPDVLALLS